MADVAPLLRDLRRLTLASNQIALAWLGQSGFAVRAGESLLLIDPFLSPHPERNFPPPIHPDEAGNVDMVLCTHDHIDHFDPETVRGVARASPGCRIVVPRPLVDRVTGLGIAPDRVLGVQPREAIGLDGVVITPVPAMHAIDVSDGYGFGFERFGGLYAFLGYVVSSGVVRCYQAGDTIRYDGMAETLRELHVDLALLPINGRDAAREARNLVGNLDPTEAAHLAADMGADTLVPMHYDMIKGNEGHPDKLVELVVTEQLALDMMIPMRGRIWVYHALSSRM